MASDLTPSPESELIKAWVRALAPSIHDLDCGKRLDGGYDLSLKLNPSSSVKQVIITKDEYDSERWRESVRHALEDANLHYWHL
jgi:hypothetical protein